MCDLVSFLININKFDLLLTFYYLLGPCKWYIICKCLSTVNLDHVLLRTGRHIIS